MDTEIPDVDASTDTRVILQMTRIATTACAGPQRRVGMVWGGLHVDAVAIEADAAQVQQRFLAQWPPGSDAHASYFARIQAGPDYHPHQVLRLED